MIAFWLHCLIKQINDAWYHLQ